MKTVYVLTYDMRLEGVYSTKSKAVAEMNRQINEQLNWYVCNISSERAEIAKRSLKISFKITEMEIL